MLTINDTFPAFQLKAVEAGPSEQFIDISDQSFNGLWKIYFFWPLDFTFVCPTEIAEFGKLNNQFFDRQTQVLGTSVDSEYVHLAWKRQEKSLQSLPFPMLADTTRQLSNALGILDPKTGVAQRATFIVDPTHVIRFAMVTDNNVGRNPKEVLRVLDALQTDELCPCNWEKGQQTLNSQLTLA